jgi:Putative peptidoglycan binding domain
MATGQGMLDLARQHIGEHYENVLVPKNNPNWRGPWDCAEFASWIVFQDSEILYGCDHDNGNPATADAYTGKWEDDSARQGIRISVNQAAGIIGAYVLRFPPGPGRMGHIAICDGQGGTVEAKGHAFGVVADTVHGRNWDTGVLIPGIGYDTNASPVAWRPPEKLYALGQRNMNPQIVRNIQEALLNAGLDPGAVDGVYGFHTIAAVGAFQKAKGLVFDGQVGVQTAELLGIQL